MAYIIPEKITRMQAYAFVDEAELNSIGGDAAILNSAKHIAERALRKIIKDCIKTEDYLGHKGKTLLLDVYVLSPDELHEVIAEARESGARDSMRWMGKDAS